MVTPFSHPLFHPLLYFLTQPTSDAAFGGFSTSLSGTVASGMFTIDVLGQGSAFSELKAIYYVLLSFVEHLKHKRVKNFTDNQSAARIVSVSS